MLVEPFLRFAGYIGNTIYITATPEPTALLELPHGGKASPITLQGCSHSHLIFLNGRSLNNSFSKALRHIRQQILPIGLHLCEELGVALQAG